MERSINKVERSMIESKREREKVCVCVSWKSGFNHFWSKIHVILVDWKTNTHLGKCKTSFHSKSPTPKSVAVDEANIKFQINTVEQHTLLNWLYRWKCERKISLIGFISEFLFRHTHTHTHTHILHAYDIWRGKVIGGGWILVPRAVKWNGKLFYFKQATKL